MYNPTYSEVQSTLSDSTINLRIPGGFTSYSHKWNFGVLVADGPSPWAALLNVTPPWPALDVDYRYSGPIGVVVPIPTLESGT